DHVATLLNEWVKSVVASSPEAKLYPDHGPRLYTAGPSRMGVEWTNVLSLAVVTSSCVTRQSFYVEFMERLMDAEATHMECIPLRPYPFLRFRLWTLTIDITHIRLNVPCIPTDFQIWHGMDVDSLCDARVADTLARLKAVHTLPNTEA